MTRKSSKTEAWMYICVMTGIASLLLALVGLFLQQWLISGILLLIIVRQAVVFPKWRKKLKQDKEAEKESEKETGKRKEGKNEDKQE